MFGSWVDNAIDWIADNPDSRLIAIVPAIYAGLWITTLVHEFGHAVCGRLAGMHIRQVWVGRGFTLGRWRMGETTFELRIPVPGGHVAVYPDLTFKKSQRALFYAGGILANLAFAVALVSLDETKTLPDAFAPALEIMILFQALGAVGNGVPMQKAGRTNDGMHLWRLWKLSYSNGSLTKAGTLYSGFLAPYGWHGGPFAHAAPRIYHLYMLNIDANQRGDAELLRQSIEAAQRELKRGLPEPEERFVLDILITNVLLSPEFARPDELDQWSSRALELAADAPTLQGSRGAALVALGRFDEGKALLADFLKNELSDAYAFLALAFLTLAETGLGDAEAARVSLKLTRDHFSHLPPEILREARWRALLEKAEAAVAP